MYLGQRFLKHGYTGKDGHAWDRQTTPGRLNPQVRLVGPRKKMSRSARLAAMSVAECVTSMSVGVSASKLRANALCLASAARLKATAGWSTTKVWRTAWRLSKVLCATLPTRIRNCLSKSVTCRCKPWCVNPTASITHIQR